MNLTTWSAAWCHISSHFICMVVLRRRLILRSVLATKTRQVPTENNIKCTKHIRARRHSSKGCQTTWLKYPQWQNLASVAKKKPFLNLQHCIGTILQQFCFRLGSVLEIGLVSWLKLVLFLQLSRGKRGGRTWCHIVAIICTLCLHSKGKNHGCKYKDRSVGEVATSARCFLLS